MKPINVIIAGLWVCLMVKGCEIDSLKERVDRLEHPALTDKEDGQ